jgi:hypothetical protein
MKNRNEGRAGRKKICNVIQKNARKGRLKKVGVVQAVSLAKSIKQHPQENIFD